MTKAATQRDAPVGAQDLTLRIFMRRPVVGSGWIKGPENRMAAATRQHAVAAG
jgi:hypothetical protein